MGFPSNDFGNQEPGTNAQIAEFCRTQYGIRFPMFAKSSVRGDNKLPLYRALIETVEGMQRGVEVRWNFEKFLIDRQGKIVARYSTATDPKSAEVVAAIEKTLAAK